MDASNFANYFVHLLHRFAVAEQSFHMHGRKKFLGGGQVSSQSRATAGAIQGKFQSLNIKRLFQEVDCAIRNASMAFLRPLSQPKAMTGGADSRSDNAVNSAHGSAPPFCRSRFSKITLRLLSPNRATARPASGARSSA